MSSIWVKFRICDFIRLKSARNSLLTRISSSCATVDTLRLWKGDWAFLGTGLNASRLESRLPWAETPVFSVMWLWLSSETVMAAVGSIWHEAGNEQNKSVGAALTIIRFVMEESWLRFSANGLRSVFWSSLVSLRGGCEGVRFFFWHLFEALSEF